MVLDLPVKTRDPGSRGLTATIERTIAPETRVPDDPDAVYSEAFIRRHTEFESLEEFCRACPCDRDTLGSVQRLSADERDAFVAATTEFETWSAMKQSATVTDIVTLTNA